MRRDLPAGTVTFLFTDVEGSTRLLDEVGDERYGELLAEHHRICRRVWAAHGGVEVDTAGDAFFVAFASAPDALTAATAAQAALGPSPLGVRMGLHTGAVSVNETGYVGLEVHRAARIAAAGHGGQVLVSSVTAGLVDGVGLRYLGEHRFKDFAAPERVFQLGTEDFPRLKSRYHTNLPVAATSFLGREQDLAGLVQQLGREDVRLLTLTGPGGTGKTRLALQAAAEVAIQYPDGVYWIALSPLRDPSLVAPTIAHALEVKEEPGHDLRVTLAEQLDGKRMLLLLDNAEHLLPELAGELAGVVRDTAVVTFVVTSRERLRIAGEFVFPVGTLDPSTGVDLFLQRSAAAGTELEPTAAVAELCERLDQLPLALELAAARTQLFTPEQLRDRLGERLDLLRGDRDADPRQATLRATIEWSYELLDPTEQTVFAALGVFAGGCTYPDAIEVASADPDSLQSLIDKSLIRRRDEPEPRYWMLETVREYAWERLVASEALEAVSGRHVARVYDLLVEQGNVGFGYPDPDWTARVLAEEANVRVALAVSSSSAPARFGEMCTHLVGVWDVRGQIAEGLEWCERAIAEVDLPSRTRVRLLDAASNFHRVRGDFVRAQARAEEEVALLDRDPDDRLLGLALRSLAAALYYVGKHEEAMSVSRRAVAASLRGGDEAEAALTLGAIGNQLMMRGDLLAARTEIDRATRLLRELCPGDYGLTVTVFNGGFVRLMLGELDDACSLFVESLELATANGFTEGIVYPIEALAMVALEQVDDERSAALLLGGAAKLREALALVIEEPQATWLERSHATLRERLSDAAYRELVDEGASLATADLIDLARAVGARGAEQALRTN